MVSSLDSIKLLANHTQARFGRIKHCCDLIQQC